MGPAAHGQIHAFLHSPHTLALRLPYGPWSSETESEWDCDCVQPGPRRVHGPHCVRACRSPRRGCKPASSPASRSAFGGRRGARGPRVVGCSHFPPTARMTSTGLALEYGLSLRSPPPLKRRLTSAGTRGRRRRALRPITTLDTEPLLLMYQAAIITI